MAEITRVPLGLQKALGLQTQGDNPSELVQAISPGLDISRYYDLRQTYWLNENVGAITGDQIFEYTIPNTEIWLMKQVYAVLRGFTTTAGDSIEVSCYAKSLQQSNNGTQFHGIGYLGQWTDGPGGGHAQFQAKVVDCEGIVLFGGTTIRVASHNSVITSGSFQGRWGCSYLRIQI